MIVVMVGTPTSGFELRGPFEDQDAAIEWGVREIGRDVGDWWLVVVEAV